MLAPRVSRWYRLTVLWLQLYWWWWNFNRHNSEARDAPGLHMDSSYCTISKCQMGSQWQKSYSLVDWRFSIKAFQTNCFHNRDTKEACQSMQVHLWHTEFKRSARTRSRYSIREYWRCSWADTERVPEMVWVVTERCRIWSIEEYSPYLRRKWVSDRGYPSWAFTWVGRAFEDRNGSFAGSWTSTGVQDSTTEEFTYYAQIRYWLTCSALVSDTASPHWAG